MIVLINPASGGGNALKKWRDFNAVFFKDNPDMQIYLINGTDKTREIFHSAIEHGEHEFIAAGGDGTVNYLLNLLIKSTDKDKLKLIKLGAVGLGSSNDFHKPGDNKLNLRGISYKLNFQSAELRDAGYIGYQQNNEWQKKYFLNNASIGITADANRLFNNPDMLLKKLKGKSISKAILYTALKTILSYRDKPLRIYSRETGSRSIRLSNLAVLKNPHISGNLCFDGEFDLTNGKVNIKLHQNLNIIQRLLLLLSLSTQNFKSILKNEIWDTNELTIEADRPVNVEYDGEVIESDQIKIGVLSNCLKVCRC